MNPAVVVYPHQLFDDSPALSAALANEWPIYLVEEPLLLTYNPTHKQKLLLHKLSMDAYEKRLADRGNHVIRLNIAEHPETEAVFKRLKADKIDRLHIVDTTDNYLERAIEQCGIERTWYESPLFLLSKDDAMARYTQSNRFMAAFYKQVRKDFDLLVDEQGDPLGGQWSFDEDNRKKIPKNTPLPEDIHFFGNAETQAAKGWVESLDADTYGECNAWLPYTHSGAESWLNDFLQHRFHSFGPYEDAMTTKGVRLWHSVLTPLLNIGLLTPKQVIDSALEYANQHDVPINSLEGFIRQIIGWREFIRASYEVDGGKMRNKNFFAHKRDLPNTFWNAKTGVMPVDHVIQSALKYGYTHHIERLMIMGNFMLLTRIKPEDVYRWFMALYIDAYDWVMVPNVYGMSQFADGGSFATKPYISGANYIKKMSDFPKGEWEEIWTALYWYFVDSNIDVFKNNHRLSMMPKSLERMKSETRETHFEKAAHYLST